MIAVDNLSLAVSVYPSIIESGSYQNLQVETMILTGEIEQGRLLLTQKNSIEVLRKLELLAIAESISSEDLHTLEKLTRKGSPGYQADTVLLFHLWAFSIKSRKWQKGPDWNCSHESKNRN